MRMSQAEYEAYLARRVPPSSAECERQATEAVALEGGLHGQIEAECRRRGWAYVHSRMDAPTTTARGVPDFIIAASRGRTLWIECKSRTGKQTPDQLGFALQCERQGHVVHVVRSFGEFLSLADRL